MHAAAGWAGGDHMMTATDHVGDTARAIQQYSAAEMPLPLIYACLK